MQAQASDLQDAMEQIEQALGLSADDDSSDEGADSQGADEGDDEDDDSGSSGAPAAPMIPTHQQMWHAEASKREKARATNRAAY
jgi:hypothetical protein